MSNRGAVAANEYLQKVGVGGVTTGTSVPSPISLYGDVNYQDPNSVINAASRAQIDAAMMSTPQMQNYLGSRSVRFDENGNPVVTETLAEPQRQLLDARVQNQQQVNALSSQMGAQVQAQQPFNAQQNQPFQLDPNGFQGMQERVYQDTLNRFQRDTESNLATNRENLRQELANTGNPVGSPAYIKAMENFEKQANLARENAISTAYNQSIGAAQAAQQTQLAGNAQAFSQNLTAYQLPYQQFTGLAGLAGRFDAPNLGPVQSVQVPTVDVGGIASGIYGQQAANQRLVQQLASSERIARGAQATQRATAGAGSLSLADRMALQQQSADLALQQQIQQGIIGGTLPDMRPNPVTSGLGGLAGGIIAGLL